jgi:hypothetical protein
MEAKPRQYLAEQLPVAALADEYRKALIAIQMDKIHHTAMPESEQQRLAGMPYVALELLLYIDWS